ncbi:NusG domain II-containing protein [Treponema sp. OMZ 840]|uniref:NusG domain II-containing protein n=1 Tax=Treponema sp. OMZ 840 TaxID=244313 RepID=UPI003D8A6B74
MTLKPIDYIIGFLFLCTAVFSFIYAVRHKGGKPRLIVTVNEKEWVYPLDVDREIEAHGALGISRIKIENGQARFLDSPCSNRTCVQSFPLRTEGDWSACLPNQVFIHVEGHTSEQSELDAVGF